MSGLINDVKTEAEKIVGDVETGADKAEDWVEKEAGLIEHRIMSSKVYRSGERICKEVDDWFATESQTLESGAVEDYKACIAKIKAIFK